MLNRTIYVGIFVALLAAFAAGRWMAPTKTITQTVEVDKKTDDKNTDAKDNTKTTIVETTKPDGTKTTTTVITDDKDTKTSDKTTDDLSLTKSKEVDHSVSKVTVSLLAV